MKYPILKALSASREMVDVFRGYNHNLRIGEGEFYDMKNLSSDHFPLLSPRAKRGVFVPNTADFGGMVAKEALCYVEGGSFVIGGKVVKSGWLTPGKKTLISMGAYVIIMPDKKYINTVPDKDGAYESGGIEAKKTTSGSASFTLCKLDGVEYGKIMPQATAPSDTSATWIDTSSEPHSLKVYSAATEEWSTVATPYVKVSADGIGKDFAVHDGVTISGAPGELDGSHVIWARDEGYIVITGMLDKVSTQDTPVTVERTMPDMDFVIESENRLWGCKYGEVGGKVVNAIYASKLGDFKNWSCFMGASTDSYEASVGTDGAFTGAITHLGYPLFFKENCVHKVYGNYPSNFGIQTTACRGVQSGCSRSLAIVNEVLYYKARSGICAYDGSLPEEISAPLGDAVYGNAVAGVLGNKYYVSMSDELGEYHLFVYDSAKGMWHREDHDEVEQFCNFGGNLYYVPHGDDSGQAPIMRVRGTGEGDVLEGDAIKWEAVTGILGTDSPDKKYISRIDVRMKLDIGTRVIFFAQYDSSGSWEHLFTMTGRTLQSFAIPIRPQRCDHLRLRIVGEGDAKIFSICKTVEDGSDV